jgi:hypothetical protein
MRSIGCSSETARTVARDFGAYMRNGGCGLYSSRSSAPIFGEMSAHRSRTTSHSGGVGRSALYPWCSMAANPFSISGPLSWNAIGYSSASGAVSGARIAVAVFLTVSRELQYFLKGGPIELGAFAGRLTSSGTGAGTSGPITMASPGASVGRNIAASRSRSPHAFSTVSRSCSFVRR